MPSAKFTQTYEKISKMGEKLKAAGKSGPSNDEQLNVRSSFPSLDKTSSPASQSSNHAFDGGGIEALRIQANISILLALRIRKGRPRQRLQRRKEARHVRFGCTSCTIPTTRTTFLRTSSLLHMQKHWNMR
jgi:hypothetical protein